MPAGVVAKYCDEFVCLSVCLSARISPEPRSRSLPFCMHVAMSVARSSSGMLTTGRIAYRHGCRPMRRSVCNAGASNGGRSLPLAENALYSVAFVTDTAHRGRSMLSTMALLQTMSALVQWACYSCWLGVIVVLHSSTHVVCSLDNNATQLAPAPPQRATINGSLTTPTTLTTSTSSR